MKPVHVLLVEDNEGDIVLTREAFEESQVSMQLTVVRDGQEAIEFLSRCRNGNPQDTPDLLLLDINLPRKNGFEVLTYIRAEADFSHLPVIMLTTSSSDRDVLESYRNYANCYITKPVEVERFLDVITRMGEHWLNRAKLPVNDSEGHQ